MNSIKKIRISNGETLPDISILLKKKGVISNKWLFEFFTKMKGYDKSIQAGTFTFENVRTNNDIIDNLVYGKPDRKKITFLGWAFKKDTNDTRESAAIYVADLLLDEMANIYVYDPKVREEQIYSDLNYLGSRSNEENKKLLSVSENPYTVCEGSHAIAILTEWDEFIDYDWHKIYDLMHKPAFIFDGRNILNAEKMQKIGFVYKGIGK